MKTKNTSRFSEASHSSAGVIPR